MIRPVIFLMALGAGLVAPLTASAQQHMFVHNHLQVKGRIAAVQGSSFRLESGATVFMHQGTVIRPVGRPLHPRQYVSINGTPAGNGNINANEVDVLFHHW